MAATAAINQLNSRAFKDRSRRTETVQDLVTDLELLFLQAGGLDDSDKRTVLINAFFEFPTVKARLERTSKWAEAVELAFVWESQTVVTERINLLRRYGAARTETTGGSTETADPTRHESDQARPEHSPARDGAPTRNDTTRTSSSLRPDPSPVPLDPDPALANSTGLTSRLPDPPTIRTINGSEVSGEDVNDSYSDSFDFEGTNASFATLVKSHPSRVGLSPNAATHDPTSLVAGAESTPKPLSGAPPPPPPPPLRTRLPLLTFRSTEDLDPRPRSRSRRSRSVDLSRPTTPAFVLDAMRPWAYDDRRSGPSPQRAARPPSFDPSRVSSEFDAYSKAPLPPRSPSLRHLARPDAPSPPSSPPSESATPMQGRVPTSAERGSPSPRLGPARAPAKLRKPRPLDLSPSTSFSTSSSSPHASRLSPLDRGPVGPASPRSSRHSRSCSTPNTPSFSFLSTSPSPVPHRLTSPIPLSPSARPPPVSSSSSSFLSSTSSSPSSSARRANRTSSLFNTLFRRHPKIETPSRAHRNAQDTLGNVRHSVTEERDDEDEGDGADRDAEVENGWQNVGRAPKSRGRPFEGLPP
ncbi:hypothetical protein JCM10212_002239 [Sporobolomyces blumeae]